MAQLEEAVAVLSVADECNNNDDDNKPKVAKLSVADEVKKKKSTDEQHVSVQSLSAEGLLPAYGDAYLFNPSVVSLLLKERPNLRLPNDTNLVLRPLKRGDYFRQYLQLLAQLTSVGDMSQAEFDARFLRLQATRPAAYYVLVVENKAKERLVASATLTLEWKFIHAAGCRGRVEDVVVDREYRGWQLGKVLLFVLTALAETLGCYKVSLDCKDHMVPWYEKFNYRLEPGNNFMVQRFPQNDEQQQRDKSNNSQLKNKI